MASPKRASCGQPGNLDGAVDGAADVAHPNPMFEYACHEGNYGLTNMMRSARHEEAVAETRQP